MERALGGSAPPEWGEWAHWWVWDDVEGVLVGFVWEHHELVKHNTWGPPSYVASHNPIDENGEGNPVWRGDGFDTAKEAFAALLARIEGRDGLP